jgi:hypothetical protein
VTYRLKAFAPVVLVLFCSLGALTANAQAKRETRVAALLFKQYESVVYTRTDFLSNFDPDAPGSPNFANEGDMRFPFLELLASMKLLAPGALSDLAKSYTAVLVGAKDFTGTNGIDLEHSTNATSASWMAAHSQTLRLTSGRHPRIHSRKTRLDLVNPS